MSLRGRIYLVVFSAGLATLTACCGFGEKSTPAVDKGPPPPPPPPISAPIAPAGDAGVTEAPAADEADNTGDAPLLETLVGTPLREKLDQRKAELAAVRYAKDFAKTYRELKALTEKLETPLQKTFDDSDQSTFFPGDLFADYPFYEVDYEAEGTAVVVTMTYPPLRERALATPEAGDDRFQNVMELLYRDARGAGWNSLESRTWDYGGCSPLGNGLHLKILLAADRARGESDLFTKEVGEFREVVLADINEDSDLFPYCSLEEIEKPTDKAKLRAEVQQILDQVTLSDAERETLETRMRAAFGGGAPPAPEPEAQAEPDSEPAPKPKHGKMARP